ncbi:MAG TPA: hypothetical protein VFC85_05500 [Verrucomicrobiae bacterium]|nr:hypothetical protein [Verrucomicrobiae bacterium]
MGGSGFWKIPDRQLLGAMFAGKNSRIAGKPKYRQRIRSMEKCITCGNTHEKSFQVILDGKTYTFDSFDCAIQALAAVCPHCHTKIIGIGVKENNKIYCSAQCATFERRLEKLLRGGFNPFHAPLKNKRAAATA